MPNTAFSATTESPMTTESCAPQITRDHRLRPKLSVPNANSAPGGRNLKRIASLVGSAGAIQRRESRRQRRRSPNRTSPVRNSRCRKARSVTRRVPRVARKSSAVGAFDGVAIHWRTRGSSSA